MKLAFKLALIGFAIHTHTHSHTMLNYSFALRRRRGLGAKPYEKLKRSPLPKKKKTSSDEFLNSQSGFFPLVFVLKSLLNFVFACFAARDALLIPVSLTIKIKKYKINNMRKRRRSKT